VNLQVCASSIRANQHIQAITYRMPTHIRKHTLASRCQRMNLYTQRLALKSCPSCAMHINAHTDRCTNVHTYTRMSAHECLCAETGPHIMPIICHARSGCLVSNKLTSANTDSIAERVDTSLTEGCVRVPHLEIFDMPLVSSSIESCCVDAANRPACGSLYMCFAGEQCLTTVLFCWVPQFSTHDEVNHP